MRIILPIALYATSAVTVNSRSILDTIYDNFLTDDHVRSKRNVPKSEERREYREYRREMMIQTWKENEELHELNRQRQEQQRLEEEKEKRAKKGGKQSRGEGRLWEPWKGDWDLKVKEDFGGELWNGYFPNLTNVEGRHNWECEDTPDNRKSQFCQFQFGEYAGKAKWDKDQKLVLPTDITKPRWNWDEDFYPEPEGKWFFHPDFKDPSGNLQYYKLRKRHSVVRANNATDRGLNRFYWYPSCNRKPECSEHSSFEGYASTCDCCSTPVAHYTVDDHIGCTVGFPTNCDYMYYEENGEQKEIEARQWCPESNEEMSEVYAHAINDIDPGYLSNDFYQDSRPVGGLPIMHLWAKWLVYAQTVKIINYQLKMPWHKPVYNRFKIATGIQVKKYYYRTDMWMNDEKKSLKCYGDNTWASRIQKSDDFKAKEIFKGNGKNEEKSTYFGKGAKPEYGSYMDWLEHDATQSMDLTLEPGGCTVVGLDVDEYGKGRGAPDLEYGYDNVDPAMWEWDIKASGVSCGNDLLRNARPMCVVSGAEVPDALKNSAIDISKEKIAPKIVKRQNEIQDVKNNIDWWKGLIASIKNLIIVTYGFLFCCCCCCQTPLCKKRGCLFAKDGFCWESLCFAPCRMVCYGGFCGWRCRKKVKDEEAADKLEYERRKAEESDSSSSGSSSSSDSD